MKQAFNAEGRRRLRGSWILLAASVVSAAGFVAGTHLYLDKEKRDAAGSARRLQEATSRLDAIRRERDSLERSAGLFRMLLDRGMMQPERRLELVELFNTLRARHRIMSVDYEIAPQRPLAIAGGAFTALDILASRVKLRIRALHEGDALAFLEALAAAEKGIHPMDRCSLRRIEASSGETLQPRIEAECTLEWITMKEKRSA